METKESADTDFQIDFQTLFQQPVANPSRALVSLLELRFHDLFEDYRNGKIDPKEMKETIKEYLILEIELFDKVLRGGLSKNFEHYAQYPDQEEVFLKNILAQIKRPDFFSNPMKYFFEAHLKKHIGFDDYQTIKGGEFTPKKIGGFVEVLQRLAQKGENQKLYRLLQDFAGDDPKSIRFFRFLLLKAAFEGFGVDTANFLPEHIPMIDKSLIQRLISRFSHLLRRRNSK